MVKPERREVVWIRQYGDSMKCDVIVANGADGIVCNCLITQLQ